MFVMCCRVAVSLFLSEGLLLKVDLLTSLLIEHE